MLIDHAAIVALVPHGGTMCLLDRVQRWDAESIVCTASSHRDPGNPLACEGRIGAACAIEYAAQAMAVHGALARLVGERPRAGLLVALRDVVLAAGALGEVAGELWIESTQLGAGAMGVMYRFRVHGDGREYASGRATVVLDVREGES